MKTAPQLRYRSDGRLLHFDPESQDRPRTHVTLIRVVDGFRCNFRPSEVIQQLELDPAVADADASTIYDKCLHFFTRKAQELHDAYLRRVGREPASVHWYPHERSSRCHACHHIVAAKWHFQCSRCRGIICPKCGACFEGRGSPPDQRSS